MKFLSGLSARYGWLVCYGVKSIRFPLIGKDSTYKNLRHILSVCFEMCAQDCNLRLALNINCSSLSTKVMGKTCTKWINMSKVTAFSTTIIVYVESWSLNIDGTLFLAWLTLHSHRHSLSQTPGTCPALAGADAAMRMVISPTVAVATPTRGKSHIVCAHAWVCACDCDRSLSQRKRKRRRRTCRNSHCAWLV